MLWHLQIDPAAGLTDLEGKRVAAEAVELGLPGPWAVAASRGFLIEGDCQPIRFVAPPSPCWLIRWSKPSRPPQPPRPRRAGNRRPRPPQARRHRSGGPERRAILRDLGFAAEAVRTVRTYRLDGPARGACPV